ncbi:unnamed protein product [Sphagnum balticum]
MSLSLGRLDEISEITPYMFLSGYGCLTEPKLAQLGVTCVVDATNIPRSRGWGNSIVHVKVSVCAAGVCARRAQVPVDDSEFAKLDVYFDDICNTIHTHREKGGKTLVHCAAGESGVWQSGHARLCRHQPFGHAMHRLPDETRKEMSRGRVSVCAQTSPLHLSEQRFLATIDRLRAHPVRCEQCAHAQRAATTRHSRHLSHRTHASETTGQSAIGADESHRVIGCA